MANNLIPTRPLGKTGLDVSILGLGGWHIRSIKDDAEAIKIMRTAIDEGITFFDNAWDYHDGAAEELMGKALAQGGYRDKVTLMTKVCARDGQGVRKQLEESLKRLQTDVIDVWQFHEINYDNDPSWIVEKGGLDEALKAQKEGKIRFLGFTGHKHPNIHMSMIDVHAWDTLQMPVNACDRYYRSFETMILPEAKKRNIAVIGMKSMGGGTGIFLENKVCTPEEAHRYALSQEIATLVSGIDSMEVLQKNLAVAQGFEPMSNDEVQALLQKVKPVAADGRNELFKSDITFDGPYHREQHGFATSS